MLSSAFFKGMGVGSGLIVAIGAQNVFLLRQGLQRHFVLACVLICVTCDVTLIALGACSVGRFVATSPVLLQVIRVGGALFLIEYGRRAAWSAWISQDRILQANSSNAFSERGPALRTAAVLSLLNPHAWLDTVVLLGAIGAQQLGQGHFYFSAGAMTASALWFSCLGFGAQMLAPFFAKPNSWRVLDALIAMTMWTIAASLFIN
jgi:L-lysine exporter family protein LysE/ArgO